MTCTPTRLLVAGRQARQTLCEWWCWIDENVVGLDEALGLACLRAQCCCARTACCRCERGERQASKAGLTVIDDIDA